MNTDTEFRSTRVVLWLLDHPIVLAPLGLLILFKVILPLGWVMFGGCTGDCQ